MTRRTTLNLERLSASATRKPRTGQRDEALDAALKQYAADWKAAKANGTPRPNMKDYMPK